MVLPPMQKGDAGGQQGNPQKFEKIEKKMGPREKREHGVHPMKNGGHGEGAPRRGFLSLRISGLRGILSLCVSCEIRPSPRLSGLGKNPVVTCVANFC